MCLWTIDTIYPVLVSSNFSIDLFYRTQMLIKIKLPVRRGSVSFNCDAHDPFSGIAVLSVWAFRWLVLGDLLGKSETVLPFLSASSLMSSWTGCLQNVLSTFWNAQLYMYRHSKLINVSNLSKSPSFPSIPDQTNPLGTHIWWRLF